MFWIALSLANIVCCVVIAVSHARTQRHIRDEIAEIRKASGVMTELKGMLKQASQEKGSR